MFKHTFRQFMNLRCIHLRFCEINIYKSIQGQLQLLQLSLVYPTRKCFKTRGKKNYNCGCRTVFTSLYVSKLRDFPANFFPSFQREFADFSHKIFSEFANFFASILLLEFCGQIKNNGVHQSETNHFNCSLRHKNHTLRQAIQDKSVQCFVLIVHRIRFVHTYFNKMHCSRLAVTVLNFQFAS